MSQRRKRSSTILVLDRIFRGHKILAIRSENLEQSRARRNFPLPGSVLEQLFPAWQYAFCVGWAGAGFDCGAACESTARTAKKGSHQD